MLTHSGGCHASRKISKCRSQFQRSAGSANQEHPSVAFENRELRLLSFLQVPVRPRPWPVRFPLYDTSGRRTPQPGFQGGQEVLSLEPSNLSPLSGPSMQSDQQLLVIEEAQTGNSYIQARGEAINAIERTIGELGGILGQLAQVVSEQSEMIQRIDANTEDVVDNVQGAQRELMKYWNSVSSKRWLIAKMFGVLMVSRFYLPSCCMRTNTTLDLLPSLGVGIWITTFVPFFHTCCIVILAILILGLRPCVYFFSFSAFFRWITMLLCRPRTPTF